MNNSWKKHNTLRALKESTIDFSDEELDLIFDRISVEASWDESVYSEEEREAMYSILRKIANLRGYSEEDLAKVYHSMNHEF